MKATDKLAITLQYNHPLRRKIGNSINKYGMILNELTSCEAKSTRFLIDLVFQEYYMRFDDLNVHESIISVYKNVIKTMRKNSLKLIGDI